MKSLTSLHSPICVGKIASELMRESIQSINRLMYYNGMGEEGVIERGRSKEIESKEEKKRSKGKERRKGREGRGGEGRGGKGSIREVTADGTMHLRT